MQNYYELLEVDKKASLEIIKKIFKIKIKQTHPDLFTGEEKIKAEERTKLLNEAYSILSDETKRAEYDKTLEQNVNSLKLLKEENQILKEQLSEIIATLSPREQKIIRLRFGIGGGRPHTLEEVGNEFDVTRERIRQIEAKALSKLRKNKETKKLHEYLK